MPLLKGSSRAVQEKNFDEFRHGKKYQQTKRKFGRKVANKQMIAAVLSSARRSKRKPKRK